jgi:hypothetical protein
LRTAVGARWISAVRTIRAHNATKARDTKADCRSRSVARGLAHNLALNRHLLCARISATLGRGADAKPETLAAQHSGIDESAARFTLKIASISSAGKPISFNSRRDGAVSPDLAAGKVCEVTAK